jgi:hypothetical protein
MNHEPNKLRPPEADVTDTAEVPVAVELDALRVREKAHTRECDAIAAARRWLPMVEMDPALALIGPRGPVTLLDAFEGRPQLIAYYFMWYPGRPAAEQCEGCTFYTTQVDELSSCIRAALPTRRFARGHTKKASATASSWAGRCRGTQPRARSMRCLSGARSANSTWCATCAAETGVLGRTGMRVAPCDSRVT